MKKKVLIIANNAGGLFGFRKELITKLLESSEVIAATPFDDRAPELERIGCRLIETEFDRRGINPYKDFFLVRKYQKIINKEKPDLVITYTIKPNIYGGIVCRQKHIPYTANITGLGTAFEKKGLLKNIVVSMYRYALRNAKTVFFENSSNLEVFIRERIVLDRQAKLLNGAGVNLDWYTLQPYPINETFRFLFVGRIMKEKGFDELLSAMSRLIHDKIPCFIDIVGPFEEDYLEQIKECEKQGWLKYHGVQNDVRPFINKCDCFVLPSWHEGMANTNLECASCGRPIITSNIPGCKEAVIEDKTGFLCEPKNVESLYNNMKRMIFLDRENRKQMGIEGRKHMERTFDKELVVKKTISNL